MLTKGALYCWALKSVSRETNRVKQGQSPRSLTPARFLGPRGGWVLTYAPGRADRGPRTRQRGHLATDRGPGRAALMFVNLGPGSQTRTDQEHKHKHGSRQQLRDQAATGTRSRHQAAAARPGRPAATRQRSAATRQRGPGSGRQRITAAAAVNQAANNCACCSNQAANNCKPGSAAHGPGSHRQQLRDANQAAAAHRYTHQVSRVQGQAPRGRPGRWPRGPG